MKTKLTSLLFICFFSYTYAQFTPVKRFDFTLLEDKVLYIPHLEFNEKSNRMQRLLKREKFEKIQKIEDKIEEYNRIWAEAMEQSSYRVTPYEIRKFDYKELKKNKDKNNVLVLRFYTDGYANDWVELVAIGPVKIQKVARALISGMDLSKVEDVRLMMNLLNFSLLEASEIEKEGEKASYNNMRRKYKENFLKFYDKMASFTFLVTKDEHKNPKKREKKNKAIQEAISSWDLSNYKIISKEELEEKRLDREQGTFYWRSFPIYTQSPFIVLQINMLLSTDNDEILFYKQFGSRKLKGSTIKDIQRNIENKAKRYQSQLQ